MVNFILARVLCRRVPAPGARWDGLGSVERAITKSSQRTSLARAARSYSPSSRKACSSHFAPPRGSLGTVSTAMPDPVALASDRNSAKALNSPRCPDPVCHEFCASRVRRNAFRGSSRQVGE